MNLVGYELQKAIGIGFLSYHQICRKSLYRLPWREYMEGQRTYNSPPESAHQLILKFQGKAIGAIEFRAHTQNIGNIRNVVIDQKLQGMRHRDAMIALTAQFARTRGFQSICVNADHIPKVIAFYKRCGFEPFVWDQDFLDSWDEETSGPKCVQMTKEL